MTGIVLPHNPSSVPWPVTWNTFSCGLETGCRDGIKGKRCAASSHFSNLKTAIVLSTLLIPDIPVYSMRTWAGREISHQELLKRAEANDYKQGSHQAEDSIKNNTMYVKKTLKDQNWALGRYKKYVQTSARSVQNIYTYTVEQVGRCDEKEKVHYDNDTFR